MTKINNITGIIKNLNIGHEGDIVVLRFKIQLGDARQIPVEMRGQRLFGVLENGDQVMMNIKSKKDKYGIVRPYQIDNLSTNSIVRMTSAGVFSKFSKFIASTMVSIFGGVITKVALDFILVKKKIPYPNKLSPYSQSAPSATSNLIPIIIAVLVGLAIFYFIYFRRRKR